jgi:DNA-binding NtrC family response regulator
MPLVLLVDDVPAMAEQYAYDLERLGEYDTAVATNGREALERIRGEPVDCVILDLEMPGVDGFQVLEEMRRLELDIPVIVYTGTGDYDRCVRAIRLGAYSFIDKAESMERVVREVENAIERERLASEVQSLKRQLDPESALIGSSPAMLQLQEAIARVAPIPSPVLILGESGSGKELVARELHRLGRNPREPFVAVNSAALPENLVESELFGHERGAFTGAASMRKGAFEAAGRGTLFLDEVGELSSAVQAKLLRVFEERQVSRLGGNRIVIVDARAIAATNRDLEAEVAAGRFRQDLLYRLNVHTVRVPALRERLSDVPELAEHLVRATCQRFGMRKKVVDPEALECLMAYDWAKNNVRELRNVLERMIIASEGNVMDIDAVPDDVRSAAAGTTPAVPRGGKTEGQQTFQQLKAEAERRIILQALERNEWHVTRTAAELGLASHSSLLKIMRRHGIRRPSGPT